MKIKVTLMGSLNKYFDGTKTKDVFLEHNMTIENLLKRIDLPRKYVSIIVVGGVKVPLDYRVQNEDEVVIYPPISGG